MSRNILLGVNIDHVATVRQARGSLYPEPVHAALEAELGGADLITLHMREDLRHIQARDVKLINAVLNTPMNLELAVTDNMISFAQEIKPRHACLVPEKRVELTTEGGLDVIANRSAITQAVQRLQEIGSQVSLFIDPDVAQIEAAAATGATVVEIHTGCYANTTNYKELDYELERIVTAAKAADSLNLLVHAGHGLNYHNVQAIAAISEIKALNIGHAIIARALFCGLKTAVAKMRQLILKGTIASVT